MIITGAILAVCAILLLLSGNRAQSRRLAALGVVALVLAIGAFASHAFGVDWERLKPYAVLEYEIKSAAETDPARAAELMIEVKRRLSRTGLDPERLSPLVDVALDAHQDPEAVWTPCYRDLVETYDQWVGLDAAQALEFRKNSISTEIEIRPTIRLGDAIPIQFRTWDSRTSTRFNAQKDYRVLSCTLDGKAVVPRFGAGTSWKRRTGDDYQPESEFILAQMHLGQAQPGLGEHRLVLAVQHRIHDYESEDPVAVWVETIDRTIEVVPRVIDGVEPFSEPEPCPLEGRVFVEAIRIERLPGARSAVWVHMNLDNVKAPASFELAARSANGEIPLGLVHVIPSDHPTGEGNRSNYRIRIETDRNIVAEKADLVFRATPEARRSSVRVLGPWPDDFVLRDVPIEWPLFFDLSDPESMRQLNELWSYQASLPRPPPDDGGDGDPDSEGGGG